MSKPVGKEQIIEIVAAGMREKTARDEYVRLQEEQTRLREELELRVEERTAELARSERSIRLVLETVELIAVTLDANGRITFCNDFLLGLTGWSREEVVGHSWFDLFIPPDIRTGIEQDVFRQTLQTGGYPAHYENDIVTRDGQRRLIHWSNTVLRDEEDRVIEVTALGDDVTDSRRLGQPSVAVAGETTG